MSLTPVNKIPGGYYLKARCIQDSAIAVAPPHVREIWDWILKEANHKDMKTHGKTIMRGQLLTDYKEIQEGLQWYVGYIRKTYEKHHVDYAMRWLRQEQMITTHKTTRGLIITVCNYGTYQDPKNYENANDYDNQKTIKRQATDRINKNVKNDKNEKYIEAAKEFYKNEFDANQSDPLSEQFKTMAFYLLGVNEQKKIYLNILQMEQQVTFPSFKTMERLSEETGESVVEIFDEMENYKDLRKKNVSVADTAMNWMRRNYKRKNAA